MQSIGASIWKDLHMVAWQTNPSIKLASTPHWRILILISFSGYQELGLRNSAGGHNKLLYWICFPLSPLSTIGITTNVQKFINESLDVLVCQMRIIYVPKIFQDHSWIKWNPSIQCTNDLYLFTGKWTKIVNYWRWRGSWIIVFWLVFTSRTDAKIS